MLGGLALLTLLTVKATFLIYMGAALAIALHELDSALKTREIRMPVIPVALGGAAMVTSAYWAAGGAVAASFALTFLAVVLVGAIATNVVGKRVLARGEQILLRVPLFRSIYAPVKQLIVAFSPENEHGFKRVVLVDDASFPGFCRVIWNAHVAEATDLDWPERNVLMNAVWQVEQAVREVMTPDKVNLASLGNVVPHLHWHVIPRFRDDTHFPNPVWASPARPVDAVQLEARRARLPALAERIRQLAGES